MNKEILIKTDGKDLDAKPNYIYIKENPDGQIRSAPRRSVEFDR